MKHLQWAQICAANYHYARHSWDYFLRSMVELDVHQIELYAGAPHLSVEDAADADVRRIKRQLDERQIAVRCLTQEQGGAVPINLATENEAVRQRSIRAFFRCIELCGLLGVDRMVALPGRGSYDLPRADSWRRAVDSLGQIARRAEECGVTVLVESSSYHNTNVGTSVEVVCQLMDEVGSPALAGLLDTCSVGAAKEDFRTCCRRLGGRLQHVHLADITPMGHLVPGDGALPLRAYLETLDAIGYRQAIGLEIYNWQYDFEPHLHMERALRTVRAWLAE